MGSVVGGIAFGAVCAWLVLENMRKSADEKKMHSTVTSRIGDENLNPNSNRDAVNKHIPVHSVDVAELHPVS